MALTPSLLDDVITGDTIPFGQTVIPRTHSSAILVDKAEVLHRGVRELHADSSGLRRGGLMLNLEERQRSVATRGPRQLLGELGESGLAWRDVAALAQVTVPAVQKWRRGGGMTGEKLLRLAKVIALLELAKDHFIGEPVSWLEMPVREGVAVSPLDMLAANRFDLVLELMSDWTSDLGVEPKLDEFDPEWRRTRTDDHHETFVAPDGVVSIRPKA